MAAHGWRRDASVEDWLFAEGHRFDFFQAVSLLEKLAEDKAGVGEGTEPSREAACFHAHVGFGFPAGDVVSVRRGETEDAPARMVIAFASLVGGLGPMPEPLAELVMRSAVLRDFGPADFLDIFHHRLVSLWYRVRKRHRLALGVRAPHEARAADHLFALIGLFTPGLRGSLRGDGRALLHYAGLLAGEVRSMAGLTAVLGHCFGVPVEGVPLTGGYRPIEERDRTRIGPSGQNRRLGDSAVVGRRVWDQQGAFELRVGPLGYDELLRFLPATPISASDDGGSSPSPTNGDEAIVAGEALAPFCEIVRFYAGEAVDFTLRLRVKADPEAAPQAAVGRPRWGETPHAPRPGRPSAQGNGPRLGYTAWIGKQRKDTRSLTVSLHADALRAAVR